MAQVERNLFLGEQKHYTNRFHKKCKCVKYETSRVNPFQNVSACNVVIDRTYVGVTGAEIEEQDLWQLLFFGFFRMG